MLACFNKIAHHYWRSNAHVAQLAFAAQYEEGSEQAAHCATHDPNRRHASLLHFIAGGPGRANHHCTGTLVLFGAPKAASF